MPYYTVTYRTIPWQIALHHVISESRLTCVSAPGADRVLLLRLEEVFLNDLAISATKRRGQFSAILATYNRLHKKYQASLIATLATLAKLENVDSLHQKKKTM